MFIDQETQKRVNIYAPYKGRSRLDTPEIRAEVGVIEIPDPARGNDETQYTAEIDEPPYVVITDKPAWMIAEATNAKVQAQIDALELNQLMPRGAREIFISLLEREAAAAGVSKEQLYAVNIGYKKLADLHKSIADLRTQFVPVVGRPE